MKSTGIVRAMDGLGRVVIPMELRRTMELNEGDPMEIFTEGQTIIIRKYATSCVFCGEPEVTDTFKGKIVCAKCRRELREGVDRRR